MAASPVPTSLLTSEDFLLLAGSILFRNVPPTTNHTPLEVCILFHTVRNTWILPKGRKDRGEDLPTTAVRETFEETGYPCELLPVDLHTRAPAPGAHTKDTVVRVGRTTEPFMISIRHLDVRDVKLTAWFVTVCAGEKQEGTQMPTEHYESAFFPVEEALERATYHDDREIITRAVSLVLTTYGQVMPSDSPQS